MKNIILAISITFIPITSIASTISQTDIIGCFSEDGENLSSSSICLFADNSFYYPMLLNITGKYKLSENKVSFTPNQTEIFEVYARYNPLIKRGASFNFTGFNLDSLINFDNMGFNYMPIEFSSCHWQPKVEIYDHPVNVSKFSLAYAPRNENIFITYDFKPDDILNDFLLIYHRPDIQKTSAIIFSDKSSENNQVWLQMGKNTLSLSRISMIPSELENLRLAGLKVADSASHFPKMINQDDKITMKNPSGYLVDKITNRMYPDPRKAKDTPEWKTIIEQQKLTGKTHYLKVYKKLKVNSQSMKQAVIEQRPDIKVNNCL